VVGVERGMARQAWGGVRRIQPKRVSRGVRRDQGGGRSGKMRVTAVLHTKKMVQGKEQACTCLISGDLPQFHEKVQNQHF
jgi:hypothetical protein